MEESLAAVTGPRKTMDDAQIEELRAAHGAFPTGVTIVTTTENGLPYGLAVNAFSSVSLQPPLVLVCVAHSSKSHPKLFGGDRVAVNILAHDQRDVAQAFARSGGDKFAGLSWHCGDYGAPVIDGAASAFEVQLTRRIIAGTHTIFLGCILAAHASDRAPLVYYKGAFFDGRGLDTAS